MSIDPLLLLFLPIASSLANFPIVDTSYGAVRGYEYRAKSGFVGEIFKKIPFAAPPTGLRRWKKPVPPERWNCTLDGTFFGPACAQVPSSWAGYVTGFSEDCLTLNVYTSRMCRESNGSCPVVVYIHGGSVLFSGSLSFPDEALVTNFARQSVILVTIAYRLGVFGAMALGDENVLPGNLAFHDIMESLRFVRKEIHNFGGEKGKITVMGHSIGSTFVLAMVFSPAFNKPGETPLFTRAIAISTSSIFETEEMQVNRSHVVAAQLGYAGTAQEIVDCLRPFSTDELLQAAVDVAGSSTLALEQISGIAMAGELMPIHNMKELRDQQKEHMEKLAESAPTHLLIGTMVDEYGSDSGGFIDPQRGFHVGDVLGVRNVAECAQKYYSDVQSGRFDPGRYDVLSQALFMTTSLFGTAQTRAGGEVYLFSMDYPLLSRHADDLKYVMGIPKNPDENQEWISRVYPIYLTNFIRGGSPAPDWTPLDPDLMNYYSINKNFADGTTPGMKLGYHQSIVEYYESMMEFDERLTAMKENFLNGPVETKSLVLSSAKLFNLEELLFYSIVIGILLFIAYEVHTFCVSGINMEKRSYYVMRQCDLR